MRMVVDTSNSASNTSDSELNDSVYDTFLNPVINKNELSKVKKKNVDEESFSSDVDRGWAWMVLAASFLSTTIVFGHMANSGIYFVTFLNAFGQSRTYTAWIITVQGISIHTTGNERLKD